LPASPAFFSSRRPTKGIGVMPPDTDFHRLAFELLGINGLPLPRTDGYEGNPYLTDSDYGRLCTIVCQRVPGITARDWWEASQGQRIAYLEAALATAVGDGAGPGSCQTTPVEESAPAADDRRPEPSTRMSPKGPELKGPFPTTMADGKSYNFYPSEPGVNLLGSITNTAHPSFKLVGEHGQAVDPGLGLEWAVYQLAGSRYVALEWAGPRTGRVLRGTEVTPEQIAHEFAKDGLPVPPGLPQPPAALSPAHGLANRQGPDGPDRPDGPEPPHWLWFKGKRHRIGRRRSRLSWLLLDYFWRRDSESFGNLQGPGLPWPDPVNDSAIATAVNRFNNALPAGFAWKLATKNRTVFKQSRDVNEQ
jgi:hypothetical protein